MSSYQDRAVNGRPTNRAGQHLVYPTSWTGPRRSNELVLFKPVYGRYKNVKGGRWSVRRDEVWRTRSSYQTSAPHRWRAWSKGAASSHSARFETQVEACEYAHRIAAEFAAGPSSGSPGYSALYHDRAWSRRIAEDIRRKYHPEEQS